MPAELRTNPIFPDSTTYLSRRSMLIDTTRITRRFLDIHPEGLNYPDGLEGLHPDELLWLGLRLLNVNDVWQGYEILGERSSRNRAWYDETIGLQHKRAYDVLEHELASSESHFEVGLDIGTGTGEVALRQAKHVKHVIGFDVSPVLLAVAGEKLDKAGAHYQLVEGDVMELDQHFPPNSIDVATMNAIDKYLTLEEMIKLYQDIHFILKPGGRLYEYRGDDYIHFRSRIEWGLSPRAALAYLVGTQVIRLSAKVENKQALNSADLGLYGEALPIENGFRIPEYIYRFVKV